MADSNFQVRKGITVANSVIITSGSNTGFNNTAPVHTVSINGNMYVNTSIVINTALTGNTTGLYHTGTINAASFSVGASLIGNTTGVYHTGTINAASFTIGSAFTANTTRIVFAATVGLQANGGVGTAGQLLTSNGTTIYWSTPASTVPGSNTYIIFNDSAVSNAVSTFTFNKSTNTLKVTGTIDDCAANTVAQTLTDAATIAWDTASGRVGTVTLGANRTFGAPTNLKVGSYILNVIQDGTGSRTITWNSVFKWPGGIAPVLTTTAAARDLFSFYSDGTNLYGSYIPDVK